MATTTKESVVSPSLTQDGAPSQDGTPAAPNAGAQTTPRTDAIGIEIPVVLYASRYSAAGRGVSKTPPPVREETRTVIVFQQGAVVRLSAKVEVGEMVVLTNQQTGADVLCRVAAVKAQPGIQNYVDLEFTQRAPGFWDAGSTPDSSARTARPAPQPAARALETPPTVLAPRQRPVSPSSSTSEVASSVAAAPPSPEPAVAATPSTPLAPESRHASLAHPVNTHVPPASNAVSGANASQRVAKSAPSLLMGERLESSRQTPPRSKKGLWAGVAAVFVAGVAAGGFLLNHRGQSAAPPTAVAVAAPIAPVQSATSIPAEVPQAAVAANPTSSTAPPSAPVQTPTWLPETPRHDKMPVENVSQPVQPASPAPRNSTIAVGKLATPIAKAPTVAGSSEPPPVLATQDSAASESVLRSGELSGASHVEAPTAFVAAETSPAQPVQPARPVQQPAAGGRVEVPKLISSPNPVYPAMARAQSLEGVVTLDALVDAAGNVTEVKAISGPALLRQAAIDALRKWKYQPGRVDSQPAAVHITVNMRFALR